MIRRASAVTSPIASTPARRPRPADTGRGPRSRSVGSRWRSAHASSLRTVASGSSRPSGHAHQPSAPSRSLSRAGNSTPSAISLTGLGEAFVRRLAADSEPLADLLPRRRRRPLGGDGQAQQLLGVVEQPHRVLDELAGRAVGGAVGRHLRARVVAEQTARLQVGDPMQIREPESQEGLELAGRAVGGGVGRHLRPRVVAEQTARLQVSDPMQI